MKPLPGWLLKRRCAWDGRFLSEQTCFCSLRCQMSGDSFNWKAIILWIPLTCFYSVCQTETKRGGIHFIITKALHSYTHNSSRQCRVLQNIGSSRISNLLHHHDLAVDKKTNKVIFHVGVAFGNAFFM